MTNRNKCVRMLKDEGLSELEARNLIDYTLAVREAVRDNPRLKRLLDAVERVT